MGRYDLISPYSGANYMVGVLVVALVAALVVYFVWRRRRHGSNRRD